VALAWALALAGSGLGSGLVAYASAWRNNGGPFALVAALLGDPLARRVSAAGAAAVAVGAAAWWSGRARARGGAHRPADLVGAFAVAIAAVFVGSPSQFPWYATWPLAFLAFFPLAPAILGAVLLTGYYVGFWIDIHLAGSPELTAPLRARLLWAEHAPVYAWCAIAAVRAIARRARSAGTPALGGQRARPGSGASEARPSRSA
jgi:hypothetical protein